MSKQTGVTLAFNRGILSTLGLARIDISRYRMAAEVMVNWIARVLGSMMLRPGWQYIANTKGNAFAKTIPFVFSTTDLARVEVTSAALRVFQSDALITRPAVTAVVTNGNFSADLSGWTVSDQVGATSSFTTGGGATLAGDGTNEAILDQQITVAQAGVEHALRIVVTRGPVMLRIGTTQGDDTYFNEAALGTGTHSLAFTPTGSFWIRVFNSNINVSLLASVNVEAAGVLELPSPWADADIPNLRWAPSAYVMEVACAGYQQRKIERWGASGPHSWSIVLYEPITGPFRVINTTPTTITPSATTGNITLESSQRLFKKTHVGALFQLTSTGQLAVADLSAESTYTNPILVNGVGAQRTLTVQVSGTYVGTLTLQSSIATPGIWVDVKSYSGFVLDDFKDGLDNEVIYYRVGFKPGDYTSGTADVSVSFPSGSIIGNVRVTDYTDSQHVDAAVLTVPGGNSASQGSVSSALGNITATNLWSEGAWSDFRGWPQAVAFHEGRLWWFGSSMFGSVSDDYENYDPTVIGDSGPIQRSIGEGPIDNISWALSMQRLAVGLPSSEWSARSSSLDAPLTPTDFVIRPFSTIGSANVQALRVDKSAIYVQFSGLRLMQADMDIYTYDYKAQDLTLMVPDLNAAGIVQLTVSRIPDTRYYCRRGDGTVAVVIVDAAENVICWQEAKTNGFVEDINVLPGTPEDNVYYSVRRIVNGQTVRFHEKQALETSCTGLPMALHADAFTLYSGAPTTTIGGLSYLEGETVIVWGWNTMTPFIDGNGNTVGKDLGTYAVKGGQITVNQTITNACVGLGYTAQWKSMKQAFAAALGTPLNQPKRIDRLGLVLQNTHALGIHMGPDFDHLDDLPYDDLPRLSTDINSAVDTDAILNTYDEQMSGFNDIWSTDSRVCLQAAAPRPCTVQAFTASMETIG